jgi:SAM-dependent methyltransferase
VTVERAVETAQDLPPELDLAYYRQTNSDVRALSDPALAIHFREHGIREGRTGSRAANRKGFLTLLDEAESILEIGPMAAPVARGRHVKYFDVLATAELKTKAAQHGMNPRDCPDVDFVSATGDLSVVDARFAAVVSSHAIEHQPDLIAHLNHVARLLQPCGRYFLLIPDKRYCFDHFVPESSIAGIIDAHLAQRTLHRAASVIENVAMRTHNDPLRHWRGDHGARQFETSPFFIQNGIDLYCNNRDKYIDTHAWQFTPASFREIIDLLYQLNLAPFRPTRVYETVYGSHEFYAVLEKAGMPVKTDGLPVDFDEEQYLAANPDVRAAGVGAKAHYMTYGTHEQRKLRP